MEPSAIPHTSLLGKLLRLPLRLIPPQTRMPVLTGPLRGKRWIVGSGNHAYWIGVFENQKGRLFERTVTSGDIVFDIGAHVGYYSLLASKLVEPHGSVVAFEPLPRNLRFLKRHLELNRAANVTVIEAAVADTNGESRFDLGRSVSMGHLSTDGTLRVRTVTLDDLVRGGELPEPTHLKIDVEGGEAKVLKGAKRVLAKACPNIFLATHGADVHAECLAILQSHGYTLRPIVGSSLEQTHEIYAIHTH